MSHKSIIPQPGILNIAPYVAGKSHAAGGNRVTKLSANENPHGPSLLAKAAYIEAAGSLEAYPNSSHTDLRAAIAMVYGLEAGRIICGAGSDEIISFLCNTYAGPGNEVLYSQYGFAMYPISAMAAGATPVQASEADLHTDVDALLAACNARTRLVFIANPNNPTGSMISEAEIARLAAGIPEQALLVLDGAYAEFVEGFNGHAALVEARDNVVMTRTFSKIFGLGGARIGWGYGPAHVIDALNRVRGPFNVSAAALAAAEAAVQDVAYTEKCRVANAQWREWLRDELASIGLPSAESFTNFIMPRFESPEAAAEADAYLQTKGLVVRALDGYGLHAHLRITIGDEIACRAVAVALTEFMKGARA